MLSLEKNHLLRARYARGFTFLETMTVLVITAIILSLGVPAMRSVIVNQRVRNASFDLSTALMMARSEASKRRANVDVIPTNGQWANGWTVSVNGVALRQQDGYSDVAINGNVPSVTYAHNGRLTNLAPVPTFNLNSTQSLSMVSQRCVTVELSGKVSTSC